MTITFIILGITLAFFVFSDLRPDLVALLSMLALFLVGVITAPQALSGFADSTVILIAALFVIGEGLARTGVTAWLGQQLIEQAGNSEVRLLVVLMLGTALLSAFLSNTGTVAMLLPAVVAAAWRVGSMPSRFLIPLAFSANLGGLLTLIGTPPNIIVSDTVTAAGLEPFGFFEFSLIGIPLLLVALGFMVLLGRRLLPERHSGEAPDDVIESVGELAESYHLPGKMFQLRVRSSSRIVGKTLAETKLGRDYGVSVLRIAHLPGSASDGLGPLQLQRRRMIESLDQLLDDDGKMPGADTVIAPQDLLVVKGNPEAVERASIEFNLGLQELEAEDAELTDLLLSHEVGIAEVLVPPRSEYVGRTIAGSHFAEKFDVQVITLRQGDRLMPRRQTALRFGDSLLVRGRWEDIERLRDERRNFVVVGRPEALARQIVEPNPQATVAVVALGVMVVLMITGLVPTVFAALIAALIMVLGGCLTMDNAYRAVNWQTVVLIAAMLPTSIALQVTGGAELIADALVNTLGAVGPHALLAGVFILTAGFSQVISNTATTVLVAPIVMQAALTLEVSPYGMLMMVAVGASAAFLTPIASPVNTLVFTPGGYSFGDFGKVGLPLMVLVLLVSLILVPMIWPA
ncbi:MAG: SLC13 family permease [Chloroflexota bacterium]|nr:SLC13 family permease [Chloroflexota bacterium]